MQTRYVEDQAVQDAIESAARVACRELDELFPGFDAGGIGSNFQGSLVDVLQQMLRGHDVLAPSKGYRTALPKLLLDEESFGDPRAAGAMFAVVRTATTDDGARFSLALNYKGTRFVSLSDGENIDPCTSFAAAVRTALAYLRRSGELPSEAKLQIKPVVFAERGFALQEAR